MQDEGDEEKANDLQNENQCESSAVHLSGVWFVFGFGFVNEVFTRGVEVPMMDGRWRCFGAGSLIRRKIFGRIKRSPMFDR